MGRYSEVDCRTAGLGRIPVITPGAAKLVAGLCDSIEPADRQNVNRYYDIEIRAVDAAMPIAAARHLRRGFERTANGVRSRSSACAPSGTPRGKGIRLP
jgi:hypothetical protein